MAPKKAFKEVGEENTRHNNKKYTGVFPPMQTTGAVNFFPTQFFGFFVLGERIECA
jgi:hypothetical protein